MRVGVTGSRGFIGRHLVEALSHEKHVSVFSFDLPPHNVLDSAAVKKFVVGKDVIIHAAAINRGSDTDVVAGSVVGTYNFVSALSTLKKKPKFIFLSSIQAETETLYGRSKRLAEIMLEDFAKQHRSSVSVFRLTNVFGEGCKPFYNSVVATFCHQVARGEKLTISDSKKILRLVYVADVAKIILKEVKTKRTTPFFLRKIDATQEITLGALAEKITSFGNSRTIPKLKSKFDRDLYHTYQSYESKA
jgi:UDP-2-acetamido-2,6-beta-L-arabino-hexul-4-ose reductase